MDRLVNFNNAKLLTDLLVRYKAISKQTVEHFNGLIVDNYPDQLITCFGSRQILQKGPERAIRAAQSLINSINQLSCPAGIQLHPRFGIATGKLMMTQLPQEHSDSKLIISGSVVHLATRLNTLASPDQILISDSAFQLAGRLFNYREAGHFQSPDEDKLETLWEVTGKNRPVLSPLPLPAHLPITPLQGLKEEREILRLRWESVLEGKGQLILLIGEPGTGKTRLTLAFKEDRIPRFYYSLNLKCSSVSSGSVFAPIKQLIEILSGFEFNDSDIIKRQKLVSLLHLYNLNSKTYLQNLSTLLSISVSNNPASELPDLKKVANKS